MYSTYDKIDLGVGVDYIYDYDSIDVQIIFWNLILYAHQRLRTSRTYGIGKSRLHKAPRNREFHSRLGNRGYIKFSQRNKRVGVRLSVAIYNHVSF